MNVLITSIQIIVSIVLVGLILLQARGGGLSSAFGGSGYYYSKRGIEKTVLWLTVLLTLVFFITSVLNFIY